MERDDITADVVARLVASQFPDWADLPLEPVALAGWDNVTFRLGDELSVRLPSHDVYAPQVEKEQRWLPVLARQLSLPIPEPVGLGRPSAEFPRPWSVCRWIDGEPAVAGVADTPTFAEDLAGFLTELHAVDTDGAPPPGAHNFHRGAPLLVYDEQTRYCIAHHAHRIDAAAATAEWEAALASTWDQPPVWVHGDVAPSNLLVRDGRLAAVIDFGGAAVGDPACDLVPVWTTFGAEAGAAFRAALPFDDATWARARGWALWKQLVSA